MNSINVAGRNISRTSPTFVVAEIGLNHNGDVSIAEQLVDQAVKCGADAVKFQTYLTEKRVPVTHPLQGLLKGCELNFDAHQRLKALADRLGVVFFSTPFDIESVALLQALDVPVFKVASFDINHQELLRCIAATKKPVFLSRGASNEQELSRAIGTLTAEGSPIALLHCVSAYPTALNDANLLAIHSLALKYEFPVGYSDHTLGVRAATWAVAAGARLIEKHFTLDRNMEGPDHAMSADPIEFKALVQSIRQVEQALGDGALCPGAAEAGIAPFRRYSS
ncbi:MAG: N-acetylneuraminate synthase family protein [Acidobacteria bacterium]|nr:N-acetylneuraminate synthase family protein [Acidobacteriota bacterium]